MKGETERMLHELAESIKTVNHNTTMIAEELKEIRKIMRKGVDYVFKIIMALISGIVGLNIIKLFF